MRVKYSPLETTIGLHLELILHHIDSVLGYISYNEELFIQLFHYIKKINENTDMINILVAELISGSLTNKPQTANKSDTQPSLMTSKKHVI